VLCFAHAFALQIYDALNALGSVAWQINKDVLRVVEEVWESGGGVGDIPPRADVPDPEPLKPRFRLVAENAQLLATFAPPTYMEDRLWKSQVRLARAPRRLRPV
jgi:DNA-directed RNA polymerase